jgi:hypothetical protein
LTEVHVTGLKKSTLVTCLNKNLKSKNNKNFNRFFFLKKKKINKKKGHPMAGLRVAESYTIFYFSSFFWPCEDGQSHT